MKHKPYEAIKSDNGKLHKISDEIVIEGPLQININGTPYSVVMRTPGDDLDLIRGLLYTEDIYKKNKNPKFNIVEESAEGFSIIDVLISKSDLGKGYLNKRTLLSVSSCGICGKQDLNSIKIEGKKIESKIKLEKLDLKRKFDIFKKNQYTFQQTGGTHAAGIFNSNNKMISFSEDIGRHNAVDKVIGKLLNGNCNTSPKILLVSGRISYEIVSKAFIFKIPVIAAVSSCSSLAIDYAKELGVTIVGFTRNNSFTIYS